ncbi:MAG TPA: YceI family protein [Pyrinomonadaceae bacterium]
MTAERYTIDPAASGFAVYTFAEGLLSSFGHDPVFGMKGFSGEAHFLTENFGEGSLSITLDPNSLQIINEIKDADKQEIERVTRQEVLETGKFPEIVFASNNVSLQWFKPNRYRARVSGDLTLHGVKQSNVWVSGEVTVTPEGLRAKGEFAIRQTDYQIKLVSVTGGTLKVRNEVKCVFDLLAGKV